MVGHPGVDLVSFTGGTATGKKVAASAAPAFKKLSLELGGKNASVVFADCDIEKTVPGVVRAGFLNQGQVCLCGSRILVEREIYDEFVDRWHPLGHVRQITGFVAGGEHHGDPGPAHPGDPTVTGAVVHRCRRGADASVHVVPKVPDVCLSVRFRVWRDIRHVAKLPVGVWL